MSLFKSPSSGEFYTPAAGQYIGKFKGHSEGPMGKDFGDGRPPQPTVKWEWDLMNLDRTPVTKDGKPVVVDALTSKATGPRSKGGQYFQAHLKRQLKNGDDMDAVQQECVDKEVMLIYTDTGDGVKLSTVLPF